VKFNGWHRNDNEKPSQTGFLRSRKTTDQIAGGFVVIKPGESGGNLPEMDR
jgi:hypothetical protein